MTLVGIEIPRITGQFIRYGCVGTFGALCHVAIIIGLVQMWGIPYWFAFFAAIPFTYTSKFLLNKYWTFRK